MGLARQAVSKLYYFTQLNALDPRREFELRSVSGQKLTEFDLLFNIFVQIVNIFNNFRILFIKSKKWPQTLKRHWKICLKCTLHKINGAWRDNLDWLERFNIYCWYSEMFWCHLGQAHTRIVSSPPLLLLSRRRATSATTTPGGSGWACCTFRRNKIFCKRKQLRLMAFELTDTCYSPVAAILLALHRYCLHWAQEEQDQQPPSRII